MMLQMQIREYLNCINAPQRVQKFEKNLPCLTYQKTYTQQKTFLRGYLVFVRKNGLFRLQNQYKTPPFNRSNTVQVSQSQEAIKLYKDPYLNSKFIKNHYFLFQLNPIISIISFLLHNKFYQICLLFSLLSRYQHYYQIIKFNLTNFRYPRFVLVLQNYPYQTNNGYDQMMIRKKCNHSHSTLNKKSKNHKQMSNVEKDKNTKTIQQTHKSKQQSRYQPHYAQFPPLYLVKITYPSYNKIIQSRKIKKKQSRHKSGGNKHGKQVIYVKI
eukprot:TRINITY_DN614_c1_g1_i7.p1 TRINITY_DN614_c1_g1~~TRINITY_DN614_c1_g1_i7.p1  ORF type:complete len:269 (+),score=-27.38 TRINITY_DN614_c1_g1_i7:369-1175(+)